MVKYEELRQQMLEANKKRMEELNLPLLSQALKNSTSPKTTPVNSFSFCLYKTKNPSFLSQKI